MIIVVASLTLVWVAAIYELHRTRLALIHESEVRTSVQAQVFAEYSRSTLKRINEFILGVRSHWTGDWERFSALVKQSQEDIVDITFQVAVIDAKGLLAYSNLAKKSDRTDLSEREHFRVHSDAAGIDQIFISKPLLGKVSGRWSIQVTRPIYIQGRFNGVVVVSLSPDQFAGFAEKLRISKGSSLTVVRSTGEIMARYPTTEISQGLVLKDRPFLGADPPVAGSYRQVSASDGIDRIFGYYRLPEYGMSFVIGEAMSDVLASYEDHRKEIISAAIGVSILTLFMFLLLSRSLGKLEEIKHQVSEILLLSPEGLVSFNERRHVQYVNPAFERMTGLVQTQITGLDESAFDETLRAICVPRAQFPGVAVLRKAQIHPLNRNPGESGGAHREVIELAALNSLILEVGLRLGNPASVSQILYFRDITYETEVDRMKSEFLSTAAHELRTPMACIYGFAEVLLTQEFDTKTTHEFLTTIYHQSELITSIINELLDLARIESRRGKDFVFETLSIAEVVDQTLSVYKAPMSRKFPVYTPPREVLRVSVDRKKIQQALNNLLSNAYKYSPDDEQVDINFRTEAIGNKRMVGVTVSDRGIGMTPDQKERVFERFFRADTSGKIPGTGLGMSIVKEIVDIHRGRIEILSTLGKGTMVTIWLPEFEHKELGVGPHFEVSKDI